MGGGSKLAAVPPVRRIGVLTRLVAGNPDAPAGGAGTATRLRQHHSGDDVPSGREPTAAVDVQRAPDQAEVDAADLITAECAARVDGARVAEGDVMDGVGGVRPHLADGPADVPGDAGRGALHEAEPGLVGGRGARADRGRAGLGRSGRRQHEDTGRNHETPGQFSPSRHAWARFPSARSEPGRRTPDVSVHHRNDHHKAPRLPHPGIRTGRAATGAGRVSPSGPKPGRPWL